MKSFRIRINTFNLVCPHCGGTLNKSDDEGGEMSQAVWAQELTANCIECGRLFKIPQEKIRRLFR